MYPDAESAGYGAHIMKRSYKQSKSIESWLNLSHLYLKYTEECLICVILWGITFVEALASTVKPWRLSEFSF